MESRHASIAGAERARHARGRVTAIRAAALAVALLAAACGNGSSPARGDAVIDPTQPGPYPVGVTRVVLEDTARGRTLTTEVWYPGDESARGLPPAPAETYLPPEYAFLAANATLPLAAVRDVPLAADGPFPLIAFSHGSGGIRFQNTFQMEHLASHGYVVVAPDHQGNTYFSGGLSIPELRIERPLDIRFVLDRFSEFTADPGSRFHGWVDLDRPFGVSGHSFGAYTSIEVANQDARIAAALPMALTGDLRDGYSAATLLMVATEDKTIGEDANAAIRATYGQLPGPRAIVEIPDAGHYSFSFACFTGLGIGNGDGCGFGTRFADGARFEFIDSARVFGIVNTYSAALFGRYVKGVGGYERWLVENADPAVMSYEVDLRGEP